MSSISKAFWKLVDKYELDNSQVKLILGNDLRNKQDLFKNHDIKLRAVYMINIHCLLRKKYPHNRSLVYSWMKTTSSEFNGKSPIQVLEDSGYKSLMALMKLKSHLNQTINQ